MASWTGNTSCCAPLAVLPSQATPRSTTAHQPGDRNAQGWARPRPPSPVHPLAGGGGWAVPGTGAGTPERVPASGVARGALARGGGGGPGGAAPLALPARGQESPAQARRGGCPYPTAPASPSAAPAPLLPPGVPGPAGAAPKEPLRVARAAPPPASPVRTLRRCLVKAAAAGGPAAFNLRSERCGRKCPGWPRCCAWRGNHFQRES